MNASLNPRGTIIKVPDATPGILFVNGQQQYFTLERVWKSPVAPVANQTVDVEFDAAGAIGAITVVTAADSKSANQERMNQISGVAQEKGKEAANVAKKFIEGLAARMGWVPLGAAVLLWIAWFFFTAVNIGIGGIQQISLSFWGLLGVDFSNPDSLAGGGSSHGAFAFLGLLCIAAPFVAPFIKAAWSKYLNAAPIVYIVLAAIVIYFQANKAFGDLAKMGVPNPMSWSFLLIFLVAPALVLGLGALKKPAIA